MSAGHHSARVDLTPAEVHDLLCKALGVPSNGRAVFNLSAFGGNGVASPDVTGVTLHYQPERDGGTAA